MEEFTEPLRNGAKLPDHPSDTTAKKIIKYGSVFDSHDGHELTAGLHDSEIRTLMNGGNPALAHLYRFAIKQVGADKRIYHTRSRVIIEVETENAPDI
jgi:hypothetical protein